MSLPRAAANVHRGVHRVIREQGVQLIHAHLSRSELVAAMSTPLGVPIVVSRRGRTFGYDERPWFRFAQGAAHRRVRLMLTNSEELAAFTLRNDRLVPPVAVVPNGVDLERFAASPLPSDPVVTIVANLIGYKRHDLFLRAFAIVLRSVPSAQAIVVGDGPERNALMDLASSLDLGDRVEFAGQVPDVRPFVERARVVALTSDHEGLPNALLEAMAMGRPVVARAVGGVPELIEDGREGWLTDADPVCDRRSPGAGARTRAAGGARSDRGPAARRVVRVGAGRRTAPRTSTVASPPASGGPAERG